MKKTFIVLTMALLAAVLLVSCDDSATDSGATDSGTTTYKEGDKGPAGGTIFFVNPNASKDGWTYLEAGKSDLTAVYSWDSANSTVDCGTKEGIGEGKNNTKLLYEKNDSDARYKYGAAYAVYGKDIYENGYTDWFVPSKEELRLIMNDTELADSIETDQFYWSSSEAYEFGSGAATNEAYALKNEADGLLVGTEERNVSHRVRPVRRF